MGTAFKNSIGFILLRLEQKGAGPLNPILIYAPDSRGWRTTISISDRFLAIMFAGRMPRQFTPG